MPKAMGPLLLTFGGLAVVLLTCTFFAVRALIRGKISYAGRNSPTRTYDRRDSPIGFWAGLGVIVYIAVLATLSAIVIALGLVGIHV